MFKRYWWMLLVMAPVGMMAGLMLAAVVTYVIPKKYESHAVIEVKPVAQADASAVSPTFFATEFEMMKSRYLLSKVIDSLDLLNRWAVDRDSALQILKTVVRTENIRGTDLIRISVRHTNKEDARDIAAETARAYRDIRRELASKHSEKVIAEIRKAVREQEDKVEERRKVLTTITRMKGEQGGANPVDKQDYADAKRDLETELSLLETLKLKLVGAEISLNAAGDPVVVHEDPVITDMPVSPKVALNLALGAGGGLLLSPFLALPLMAFMNRKPVAAA